jgi:hypothetical protein
MNQRFTLFLIISLFSAGVFGQAYPEFTPPQKPKLHERPSGYHDMLHSYKAYKQHTLLKSASDLSTYLDTAQVQVLLDNGQYLPVMNQIITYDVSGNMTKVQIIVLNSQTFQWEDYSLTELSYDAGGNISQVISEGWNEDFTVWIRNKTEYSYDASDFLIQILDYEWDESTSQYINSRKVDRTINEAGLAIQVLVSSWQTNPEQWVEVWKYDYSYNVNDALLVETEYGWDDDASDWVLSWKAQYTYDENDKLSVTEQFNWDSQSSSWGNLWKTTLTYDASENVDQQLDSAFLESGGPWQERRTAEYTYDEQNNPLTEIYSVWDESTAQLLLDEKFEYIYDNGTLLSELIAPPLNWFVSDYSEQIVSKPLVYVRNLYNTETSTFDIWFQEVYLYNEHYPTHVIGSETSHIATIFPNPASEYITLDFAGEYHEVRFELFDVTGRRVILKEVENGERLNLEGLQNGIFLFRISAEEQIQTGKLTIK